MHYILLDLWGSTCLHFTFVRCTPEHILSGICGNVAHLLLCSFCVQHMTQGRCSMSLGCHCMHLSQTDCSGQSFACNHPRGPLVMCFSGARGHSLRPCVFDVVPETLQVFLVRCASVHRTPHVLRSASSAQLSLSRSQVHVCLPNLPVLERVPGP